MNYIYITLNSVAFIIPMLYLSDYDRQMIRFKLQERLAAKSFADGKRITLDDVALATGIHRTTLSRMNQPLGANITSDNLDRLCHFFGCQLHELAQYVPSEPPEPRKRPTRASESAQS